MKTVAGVEFLKFAALYGPVLRKIAKCHKHRQKTNKQTNVTACISPDYHTFHKIWLKLDEECGGSRILKTLTLEILQSSPNYPKLNSKNQTWKVPYIYSSYDHESQIFIRLALWSTVFKVLYIFTISPLTAMLNFHWLFIIKFGENNWEK